MSTNDGAAAVPRRGRSHSVFETVSSAVTRAVGTVWAFGLAIGCVVVWAVTGPFFHYSDYWQLVINTGTTIVTFLMVFLIQQSQNKDSVAIHLKLNELLASHRTASNRLVAIEDLDERELHELRAFYCRIADLADKSGADIERTHSSAEAAALNERKADAHKPE